MLAVMTGHRGFLQSLIVAVAVTVTVPVMVAVMVTKVVVGVMDVRMGLGVIHVVSFEVVRLVIVVGVMVIVMSEIERVR